MRRVCFLVAIWLISISHSNANNRNDILFNHGYGIEYTLGLYPYYEPRVELLDSFEFRFRVSYVLAMAQISSELGVNNLFGSSIGFYAGATRLFVWSIEFTGVQAGLDFNKPNSNSFWRFGFSYGKQKVHEGTISEKYRYLPTISYGIRL